MITIDGKQFRNLEEQVLKNQDDIKFILNEKGALNQFGLKVVGNVDTASELPDPETYFQGHGEDEAYGDAYLIGAEAPFTMSILTREFSGTTGPQWFNIGQFPLSGPAGQQGPTGPQGEKGKNGTEWIVDGTNMVPSGTDFNDGDLFLSSTGFVMKFNKSNRSWMLMFSIAGPQGPQGLVGPQGIQGPQGPQGPQGIQGDVGGFINIAGIIVSENQLPDPETLKDLTKAYLVGSSSPYNLYIQVGSTPASAVWEDMGNLNVGTYVTVAGKYQNVLDMDNYQRKIETVELTTAPSATTGTITQSQIDTLQADRNNILVFNNEIYKLADEQALSGYLVYSHVGQDNTQNFFAKCITITLSTLTWVLTSQNLSQNQSKLKIMTIPSPDEYTSGTIPQSYLEILLENDWNLVSRDGLFTLTQKELLNGKPKKLIYSNISKSDLNDEFILKRITFDVLDSGEANWNLTIGDTTSGGGGGDMFELTIFISKTISGTGTEYDGKFMYIILSCNSLKSNPTSAQILEILKSGSIFSSCKGVIGDNNQIEYFGFNEDGFFSAAVQAFSFDGDDQSIYIDELFVDLGEISEDEILLLSSRKIN